MGKIKVVSLFSGCGGIDLGVKGGFSFLGRKYEYQNAEVVYANDIDEKICDIFDANFDIKIDRRDIRTVNAKEIPKHDLLIAGFPCQSFSILAQNPPRLGFKDDRGRLFFEVLRVLKHHNPKYFILENVKGLLSANKGKAFPLILDQLRNIGYEVAYKVLNAKDFGVPQKRERVIIVGWQKELNLNYDFSFLEIAGKPTPLAKVLEKKIDQKYFFSEKAVQGMLKSNAETNGLMNKGRVQDPTKPCNTVTAHLAKVTLNGTDPVFMENKRYRRFTPREVARIQSFPDDFNLIGSDTSKYKALGNAVPPVMFWHVFNSILKAIAQVERKKTTVKRDLDIAL